MNKTPDYHTSDILRYLKKEMSNAEMRQLELAALNDPFLQDAIDGYRETYETKGSESLQPSLREALSYRGRTDESPKILPLWRRKIVQYAAAAAIVAGTGWFIFNISQPETNVTGVTPENATTTTILPDTETTEMLPVVPPGKSLAEEADAPKEALVAKTGKPPVNTETASKPEEKPGSLSSGQPRVTFPKKADSPQPVAAIPPVGTGGPRETTAPPAAFSTEFLEKNSQTKHAEDYKLARKAGERMARSSFAQSNLYRQTRKVKGKVVDNEQYPLDNIRLQVEGTTKYILSDELGRFEMELPDTGATIIASAPGYKTTGTQVKKGMTVVEIEMESTGRSLEEMVVSDYSTRKKASSFEIDTTETAPAGGWKQFEAYILKNKKISAKGPQPVYVVLSFEVTDKGRPAEFDIIRSGGDSYNKEAIRLLKAGPAWINKTPSSGPMAKITIIF